MEPFWYRVGDGMNRWISLVKTGWGRKMMLTGQQGKGLRTVGVKCKVGSKMFLHH